MRTRDVDQILNQAVNRPAPGIDGQAIERIKASLPLSLRPVRPIAPVWVFAAAFFFVSIAVAAIGAFALGMYGVRVLSITSAAAIFSTLGLSATIAAVAIAREMRPAGGRHLGVFAFLIGTIGLLIVFALVFDDYGIRDFVRQGIPCLRVGMIFAVPAALIVWFLLWRGFILNASMAGFAAGTLAGLAGIGMLELHCPNLKAVHIMVWHVGVVLLCGLAGWLIGWGSQTLRPRRP
jgi:hypothetical protein